MDDTGTAAAPARAPYDLSMAQADYPIWNGPPDRTILVCSHPRSGSTLIGETLYAAGGLGCPLEYLHRGFRPNIAARWRAPDLESHVRAMHRFRTDPTGVFSIKLFWRDIEETLVETGVFEESELGQQAPPPDPAQLRRIHDFVRAILPNPAFVHLKRRDRVRQAVSAFIATQTNVFRSLTPADRVSRPVVYDYDGILRQLAVADYSNARWTEFFAVCGIEPYRLAYEDLASHYEGAAGSLLAHLGRPIRPAPPRLQRQATAQSEDFLLRFLRDHAQWS